MKAKSREHALLVVFLVGSFGLTASYGQYRQAEAFSGVTMAESAPAGNSADLSVSVPATNTVVSSAYGTPTAYGIADGNVLPTHSGHRQTPSSTALIVLAEQDSTEDLDILTEDLNIMCRLLDRTLTGAGLRSERRDVFSQLMMRQSGHTWPDRLFGDASSWTECLYVEGHGPLFVMNVDFPLVESPQDEAPRDPNAPGDPVWAEVSRDLRGQPGSRTDQQGAAQPSFNPVKVLALRKALTRALKHASNIRGLAPEATVTVMVQGRQVIRSPRGAMPGSNAGFGDLFTVLDAARGETVKTSRLVIRVRMEDVNAFSSGAASEADFNQRIQTVQY